jgi:uncharacterized RDD family membrane protein YckC
MNRVDKVSLKSLFSVLPKKDVRKIHSFALARVLANLLDVLGLAGIALLAASFGAIAEVGGGGASISIPGLGNIVITEAHALVIAFVIAATFVLKSGFSIWVLPAKNLMG